MSSEVSYENGRLTVTRTFQAPREAVFAAWIETSKVQLWWGCGYATKVKSEIEPQVGGQYSHLMTLRDVGEYQQHGRIIAYEPPALLAYELIDPFHDQPMNVRVEFTQDGNKTVVRLTQDNLCDEYSDYVMGGWSSAWEGLAYLLRTGDAPRTRTVEAQT